MAIYGSFFIIKAPEARNAGADAKQYARRPQQKKFRFVLTGMAGDKQLDHIKLNIGACPEIIRIALHRKDEITNFNVLDYPLWSNSDVASVS